MAGNQTPIQHFPAPSDGVLSPDMVAAYENEGVLVLEGMFSAEQCAALMARAGELAENFDPGQTRPCSPPPPGPMTGMRI